MSRKKLDVFIIIIIIFLMAISIFNLLLPKNVLGSALNIIVIVCGIIYIMTYVIKIKIDKNKR